MPGGGLSWLALAAAGMAAFFWSGLASLLVAWSQPEYSHGYLIPFIALYLLVTRSALPAGKGDRGRLGWLGAMLVVPGIMLGLIGNLASIPDVTTYGLILCIGGLALAVSGARYGLAILLPVAYLLFMLPLPNFVYWPLSIKLQLISSQIGVAVISAFGVPVFLDGNIIDLGVYKLQVAEACSGLRYLFPLMSFSFLFALLYKGPFWHRAVLFLSALPITVLMNSFRIGVIGLLVDRYGIEQAEGFLHAFEGWIIFVACVAILFLLAALLQRFAREPQPILGMLEIDPKMMLQRLGSVRSLEFSRPAVTATTLILLAGFAWQLAPSRAHLRVERTPLVLFPAEMADWRGRSESLDKNVERVLAADDYLVANYTSAATPPVNVLIAYYNSQTSGSGIHSPEVCIPTGGWEVSGWRSFETGLDVASGQSLTVNRAIIQKGLSRQLVYYWFEQRGRALTSDYAAKAYTLLDSITRDRTDGALVRLVTPIEATEAPAAADGRLLGFLRLMLPRLPAHVPG